MQHHSKAKTTHCEIWVDQEGFLILTMHPETEIDLEEVRECFETYKTLGFGNGNKALQLIISGDNSTMPPEAREYAVEHGKHFFHASALVGNSLAIRLIVNFFNTFYKHPVPFKMFSSEEEARAWLRTFRT